MHVSQYAQLRTDILVYRCVSELACQSRCGKSGTQDENVFWSFWIEAKHCLFRQVNSPETSPGPRVLQQNSIPMRVGEN
ncbi:hypothetical protein BS78_10G037700 [Paspalum vaginatum]|nr:hypothetical protein BS78_10G037700 [Paspalum vaginatum]